MDAPSTALLVDHDPIIADVLRVGLAGKPFTLDVAYDVPTAVRCLDSGRYCGLILDLALPQEGSLDVLRHMSLRRISLPTIVISKRLTESLRQTLAREQVKLVLPKPVETTLLISMVVGLCGLASYEVRDAHGDRGRAAPDELRDADFLRPRL